MRRTLTTGELLAMGVLPVMGALLRRRMFTMGALLAMRPNSIAVRKHLHKRLLRGTRLVTCVSALLTVALG